MTDGYKAEEYIKKLVGSCEAEIQQVLEKIAKIGRKASEMAILIANADLASNIVMDGLTGQDCAGVTPQTLVGGMERSVLIAGMRVEGDRKGIDVQGFFDQIGDNEVPVVVIVGGRLYTRKVGFVPKGGIRA